MENMSEALKIVFAVLMFVIALTLSISSFSQAKIAVDTIITIRDKRTGYIESDTNKDIYNAYITPSEDLSRTVGIETVVSTMYNTLVGSEEIEICFFDGLGNPIKLYYKTTNGEIDRDATGSPIAETSIKLSSESFGAEYADLKKVHLDLILGGKSVVDTIIEETLEGKYTEEVIDDCIKSYKDRMIYSDGLYKEFKNFKFKEQLGEYIENEGTTTERTVRIITYTLVS